MTDKATKDAAPEENKTSDTSNEDRVLSAMIQESAQKALKDLLASDETRKSFASAFITPTDQAKARGENYTEADKATAVTRIVRSLAYGKGNPDRAEYFVGKANWDDRPGELVSKALAAGDFTAGGFMVPEDLSQSVIDLLRPRVVIRAMGTNTVPMPNGTLSLPRQTADISAAYVGENQNITKTEPTGGQIQMTAKKLAALVPISNDLLRYDIGDAADRFVRNSLVRRIAVREDAAFIRDDGTQDTPKGLRYWAQSANVSASNGTSAANIEADFTDLLENLEGNNVDMSGPAWIMSSRSKNHLLNLRDGNGNRIYPEMSLTSPTIHGIPVYITNSIPNTLGGGTATEVYLVNVPDLIIGENGGLEIMVDNGASYVEGGSLQSAFAKDQTVIRAILRHDFAVAYNEAVAVKTGVTWGA